MQKLKCTLGGTEKLERRKVNTIDGKVALRRRTINPISHSRAQASSFDTAGFAFDAFTASSRARFSRANAAKATLSHGEVSEPAAASGSGIPNNGHDISQ
jgi:hypothetical protein